MCGWTDGCMAMYRGGWMYKFIGGGLDIDVWMGGWMYGWMDRFVCMDGWMDEWIIEGDG